MMHISEIIKELEQYAMTQHVRLSEAENLLSLISDLIQGEYAEPMKKQIHEYFEKYKE